MPKLLIVYYSRSGNTKQMAELVADGARKEKDPMKHRYLNRIALAAVAITLILGLPACDGDDGMVIIDMGVIGDRVWLDSDLDGIQDEAERGEPGIAVRLFNAVDLSWEEKTTDVSGHYEFTGVESGKYFIEFVLPDFHVFTSRDVGGDDALDSDAYLANGRTDNFEYEAEEENRTFDAGLIPFELIPTPTPYPTTPLDFFFEFASLPQSARMMIADDLKSDDADDQIYSISTKEIIADLLATDIHNYGAWFLYYDDILVEIFFGNTLFPCDTEVDGVLTVCPEGVGPMPVGDVLMLAMVLDAEVPLETQENYYSYSAVLDADGDPANNFRFQSPYDWDYYQGTDRWYILDWSPNEGTWYLDVSDYGKGLWTAPSNARSVIMGDLVIFFIPAEEFSVERPGYRLTAFAHDGNYTPDLSSGDVTGADPTEALSEVPEETVTISE